jgi:hypothetical protein
MIILCTSAILVSFFQISPLVIYNQNNVTQKYLFGFIDPIVKISDLLTSVVILLSIGSLIITLKKEEHSRQIDQVNKIKSSAVDVIGKLAKWRSVSFLIFEQMDVIFVNTSEELMKDFEHPWQARDYMWKMLRIQRYKSLDKMLKYNLIGGFGNSGSYNPYIDLFFEEVLKRLREEEEAMFQIGLLENSARYIDQYFDKGKDNYDVANLRNDLVNDAEKVKTIYDREIESIIEISRNKLMNIINMEEKDLLNEIRYDRSIINILNDKLIRVIKSETKKETEKMGLNILLSIEFSGVNESIYDMRTLADRPIEWPKAEFEFELN